MSIEVINNFSFTDGKIFEVKFNDLTTNSSKASRFQWYMILKDVRFDLKYVDTVDKVRILEHPLFFLNLDVNDLTLILLKNQKDEDNSPNTKTSETFDLDIKDSFYNLTKI
jgi:hypothetical protein